MNISKQISRKIEKMKGGNIFNYASFSEFINTNNNRIGAVVKAMSRLEKSGRIKRLSKGRYLKPEKSIFGTLPPNESEIIKSFTIENNKRIGYLTGNIIYNRLGITSQISNTIEIATNKQRSIKQIGSTKIKFRIIRSNISITEKNIPFLQILDVINNIKKIPGVEPNTVVVFLKQKFKNYNTKDLITITELAQNYPSLTRALLGAILEELENNSLALKLKASLNPLTSYKLSIGEKILSNKSKWNIL